MMDTEGVFESDVFDDDIDFACQDPATGRVQQASLAQLERVRAIRIPSSDAVDLYEGHELEALFS